jgi:hypothetical protein
MFSFLGSARERAPWSGLLATLGLLAGCDAEPADVLSTLDPEQTSDGGAPLDSGPVAPDAGCACTPGFSVSCLEASGPTATGCVLTAGRKRCQPDGTWGPCSATTSAPDLENLTLTQLTELSAMMPACTIFSTTCGLASETIFLSGDCGGAFRCAPTSDSATPF